MSAAGLIANLGAENLDCAELTQLEHKEHIAEWIRLTDQAKKLDQPEPVSKGGRGVEGGIRAASRELGIPRMEAVRSDRIAKMAPEAEQIARDLALDDNQSALLKAARRARVLRFLAPWTASGGGYEVRVGRTRLSAEVLSDDALEDLARHVLPPEAARFANSLFSAETARAA